MYNVYVRLKASCCSKSPEITIIPILVINNEFGLNNLKFKAVEWIFRPEVLEPRLIEFKEGRYI